MINNIIAIDSDLDDYQEKVWEALKQHGRVELLHEGGNREVIVGLTYYREHNEGFNAGFKLEDGYLCEQCNIPKEELEKIAPGLGVMWNSAEAFHSKDYSNGAFTEEEIQQIDEAFHKAGFEMDIDA